MMMSSVNINIQSPAKINLFLHVTGKRNDGYHDLFSLMAPVDLWDDITITPGGNGITIFCKTPGVPEDERNLAFKAADLFFREINVKDDVTVKIEKNIPVAGGLGGGSGNAAATLVGLNDLYGDPVDKKRLYELGLKIGADVPFFIYGKPALARGVGEILTPFPNLRPYNVILILPGFHVSTADVFKNLNLGLTKLKKTNIESYFDKGVFDPYKDAHNDLEAVTVCKYREIDVCKQVLADSGALMTLMSGSGPCVFGIYEDEKSAETAYYYAEKNLTDCFLDKTSEEKAGDCTAETKEKKFRIVKTKIITSSI